jgi:hypothetical protein
MNLEKYIQRKLNNEIYHGIEEVSNIHGRIDILTPTDIVEVKEIAKYKHGVGQLLAYSTLYPNRTLILYVFGTPDEIGRYQNPCISYCSNYNIEYKVAKVDVTLEFLS